MKVLMITPQFGGIDAYVRPLADEMSKQNVTVDIVGSTEEDFPIDPLTKGWQSSRWTIERAKLLNERLDLNKYDIVVFHYGKNDIEQYLPLIMDKNILKEKAIYFVHFLSWTLFGRYLNDIQTNTAVNEAVYKNFDKYVFFGSYSKDYLSKLANRNLEVPVIFYPEAHSFVNISSNDEKMFEEDLTFPEDKLPAVYIIGYGSRYKDPIAIINSLHLVKTPFKLIFAGEGWRKRIGINNKKIINNVHVYSIERVLNTKEFLYLTKKTVFGIFPYIQPENSDEIFQGSGVLPNYIYNGKASIVFDNGCLKEYVSDSGIVLASSPSPESIAKAIDQLLDPEIRKKFEESAMKRSQLFSISKHATDCINYFNKILKDRND